MVTVITTSIFIFCNGRFYVNIFTRFWNVSCFSWNG